jgi:hypothetical protein
MMNRTLFTTAIGTLIAAGISTASAQTVIVEEGYGPPVYRIAPAPMYSAPVVVAPTSRLYAAPAPIYAAPPIRTRPLVREVIETEPTAMWAPAPEVIYPDW